MNTFTRTLLGSATALLAFVVAMPALAEDLSSLQGTWEAVSAEKDGAAVDATGRSIIVDQNKLTFMKDGRVDGPVLNFELTETSNPKGLDLIIEQDGSKVAVPGIYQLEGNQLTVCYTVPGQARPTQFSTRAGDMRLLAVLKRKP